jgi:hypothetical protein
VNQLNLSPAQIPGVYGSVCGAQLSALARLSPPPTFIWGGDPDGNSNPSDLWYPPANCGVSSGLWVNNQRLKQSEEVGSGQSGATWGGVSSPGSIDVDCADSYTNPSGGGAPSVYKCTYY